MAGDSTLEQSVRSVLEQFAEPGLFLIGPDRTLYYDAAQTMPFARPSFDDLAKDIDFALAKNYPARGEIV